MSTVAGVGLSRLVNPEEAGGAAAAGARERLGRIPDLTLVFATARYDQNRLLAGVREQTGGGSLSGCSAEGVIAGPESVETDHAVSVMAIASDQFRFEPVLLPGYAEDPSGCGTRLAASIRKGGLDDVVGLILLPDGLTGDCTRLLRALEHDLGTSIPVVGGTAADAMTLEATYQYKDDEVARGAVAAVAVRGRGTMRVAVSHGCEPIGLERTITRAENGWVYEIDDLPAWSVFKEYLDGDPQDLNVDGILHLCVGLPLPEAPGDRSPFVIRTPLGLDRERGALFFPGGGLHSGQPIRLTRRDQQQITRGARACAETILDSEPGTRPSVVLQFDCAGRGKVLFGSCAADEIIKPLRETLGEDIPWMGFHTYGEIASMRDTAHYHNYTVALCALYDTP